MDRGNEVPLRVGGVFAFAGLLGVLAVVSFQPSADVEVNQLLVRSELAKAQEQLASLKVSLQVGEREAVAYVANKIESAEIRRVESVLSGEKEVEVAQPVVRSVWGTDKCNKTEDGPDGTKITIADKYSDPWQTSFWRWGFLVLALLGVALLAAQIIDIIDESNPEGAEVPWLIHVVIQSIKSVDTFKQLCAYDPYKDAGQAPSGNAYRLLAVVGPDIGNIGSHNDDGSNPEKKDRTDGGYKCTMPNLLGYGLTCFMTFCILVMQLYIPYTLLAGVIGDSKFIGFKVLQYYFDFPLRLGLELVPLTLMSMKFFVKVEKVVRDEFNQCMWLFKAALNKQIQFQIFGRPWSLFWITVSFVANTYIAVCMTFYVVFAICTYEGGDIMSFFLKVLGSLGLISFDDDIMGALPQWSGWYAEHTNCAGHPLGGHPMGCPADFFAGPESVRAGGDKGAWGYGAAEFVKTVTVDADTLDTASLLGLSDASGSRWFDGDDLTVTQDHTLAGVELAKGMVLSDVHGKLITKTEGSNTTKEERIKANLINITNATRKDDTPVTLPNITHKDDLGVDFAGDGVTVDKVHAHGIAAKENIQEGAVLTHLNGDRIQDKEHLGRLESTASKPVDGRSTSVTFVNKKRGAEGGMFSKQRTVKFVFRLTRAVAKAKLDRAEKLEEKGFEPRKATYTKFVKLGLQFSEGCEELGFRLTGTTVTAVMQEECSAAFNAVNMTEVTHGRPDLGLEKYAGVGQPHGTERYKYLYKGRGFIPKMFDQLINSEEREPPKPKETGMQLGMFIVKIQDTQVNSFGDIAKCFRYIKGDNLNYSDMQYDGDAEGEEEWANEWRGGDKWLTRVKGKDGIRSKEFTMVIGRAGDEDSNFDDFVHGFIYMLIRVLLLFSLLFILISYWQKDCKHVGV